VRGSLKMRPYTVDDLEEFYFYINEPEDRYRVTSYEIIGNKHENLKLLEKECGY